MQTLPIEPYGALRVTRQPRVRTISFGDGYEQRVKDGINHDLQIWRVSYTRQQGADMEALDVFFQGLEAVQAFLWTPPKQTAARTFVCQSWERSLDEYDAVQSLTCTFREVPEVPVA